MTIKCNEIEHAISHFDHCVDRNKRIPSIALIGANNATKSSLANVLSGHKESGFFVVGEGSVTHEVTSCEFEGRLYSDTPGTGFSSEDDATAINAYRQIDVFVMAHRLDCGELDAHEIKWLKDFLPAFKGDLIMAITVSDTKDEEDQLTIKTNIQAQLGALNMADTPIVLVSCNRYYSGIEFSSAKFIQLSGIEALQQQISNACDGIVLSRRRKLDKAMEYVQSAISNHAEHLKQQRLSIIKTQKKQSKDIDRAVDLIAKTYS